VLIRGAPALTAEQLKAIWKLADSNHDGKMNREELGVLFGLMSQGQAGLEPSLSTLSAETPPPGIAGLPTPTTEAFAATVATDEGAAANPALLAMATKLFRMFKVAADRSLDGKQLKLVMVRGVPLLPKDTLGSIWRLADQNKDGVMDLSETGKLTLRLLLSAVLAP